MDSQKFEHTGRDRGWNKELFYQLVDSVRDYAIFMTGLDGTLISWNLGAELLFGYGSDEAIGRNIEILFTPEDRANRIPELERETARKTGCADDERWHMRKDGERFFVSGVQTAVYDAEGEHKGYAKICRDLTERVEFQTQLQTAHDTLEAKVSERTNELAGSNEALRVEVTSRKKSEEARVALLRKIVNAQEDERKRIARDIHDHIGQELVGITYKLDELKKRYGNDKELMTEMSGLLTMVKKIDSEVDFLAWELRPSIIDHLGLSVALQNYTSEWAKHFDTRAEFHHSGFESKYLVPEIEINLYRIGQEALNNVAKHANAKNASVLLERFDGTVSMVIEDDGIGFDKAKRTHITEGDRGMGLLGMKERAELVGGTLSIESTPGSGTTVLVRVPAQFDETRSS